MNKKKSMTKNPPPYPQTRHPGGCTGGYPGGAVSGGGPGVGLLGVVGIGILGFRV